MLSNVHVVELARINCLRNFSRKLWGAGNGSQSADVVNLELPAYCFCNLSSVLLTLYNITGYCNNTSV